MANKLTNTQARALAGENVDVAPHIQYPHDGAQSNDPVAEKFDFFRKLVQASHELPRVDDPNFKPPIVVFDDFFTGGSELDPQAGDDPETDGEGFKFGTVNELNEWFVGGTNAANGGLTVEDDAIGGWIAIDTANVEDDNLCAQLLGAPFLMAVGTPLYFEARIMLEDVDKMSWFVGLALKDQTDVTGSGTWGNCDDCIGFHGEEELSIHCASSKDGVDTTADTLVDFADGTIATIGATTVKRLGFHWDGVDTVKFYVEGALVATINTTDDDINVDELVTPTIAVDASNADADKVKMWLDYIFVVQERP